MKCTERSRSMFVSRVLIVGLAVSVVPHFRRFRSALLEVWFWIIRGRDTRCQRLSREPRDGAQRSANSDSGGRYLIAELAAGNLRGQRAALGLCTLVQTVTVSTGGSSRVDSATPARGR